MISRRQFLKYSAAVGALPLLGDGEVPQAVIRLAAIGLDETAMCHLDAAIGTGRVEVVAIADAAAVRYEVLANCFRRPRILPSIGSDGLEAIAASGADAIFIGSAHAECMPWIEAALAQRHDVLLQALPAMPLEQWDCLVKQFHEAGRTLEYASPWRQDAAFERFVGMLGRSDASRWNRISISCSAPARDMACSLESPPHRIVSAFLPMFDALSHLPADMTPEVVFATGDPMRKRRGWSVPRKTFVGAIKTRGRIEVSLSCSIVPDPSGHAGSLEMAVANAQQDASHALRLDRLQRDVAPFWANQVAANRRKARSVAVHRSHDLAAVWARELSRSWATGQTLRLDCPPRVYESMT